MRWLILMAAFLLVSCGAGAEPAAGPRLYTTNCGACHGATGGGTSAAPSFLELDVSDDAIRSAVRNGVDDRPEFPAMAPVGGLADDDIELIIAHIRSLQAGG